jgi:hypothetical protein
VIQAGTYEAALKTARLTNVAVSGRIWKHALEAKLRYYAKIRLERVRKTRGKLRRGVVAAEIRTERLQNAFLEHRHFTDPHRNLRSFLSDREASRP